MLEYAIRSLYVCVGFYTVTIPLRRAVLLIMMELCYGGLHNIIYIYTAGIIKKQINISSHRCRNCILKEYMSGLRT